MAATLSTLQTRVRQRANMEATQFVTDSEVTAYINAAASELYQLLAETRNDWFMVPETETISSGNTVDLSSALASRALMIVGVDYSVGGTWVPLDEYHFDERGNVNQTQATTGSYRIWYVPEMTLLSDTGHTLHWSIPQSLEEFVVIGAAIRCRDKEESDVSVLMAEQARLRRAAEFLAVTRKRAGRISDNDGENNAGRSIYYGSTDANRVYQIIGTLLYVYATGVP